MLITSWAPPLGVDRIPVPRAGRRHFCSRQPRRSHSQSLEVTLLLALVAAGRVLCPRGAAAMRVDPINGPSL